MNSLPSLESGVVLPFTVRFDQLSLSSCLIELQADGKKFGHATGFFWRESDGIFLVTNWHVVTGKDPFTKVFIRHGRCPDSLLIHFLCYAEPCSGFNKVFQQKKILIQLYEDYLSPCWIQHKQCIELGIDVILLSVPKENVGHDCSSIVCLNDYSFEKLFHYVGGDVFIIGYPIDDDAELKLPVWKRGSIASELLAAWKNRPAFLIDCRTSQGMSGSPVVRRVFGPATTSTLQTKLDAVVTSEFMGIYSGRLFDDENVASIGLVWWCSVIDEIIASPSTGDRGL